MTNGANDRRALWMFISSMVIFGTIGIFRRAIPLSSAFLTFSRGILGGGFLIAFTALRKKERRKLPPRLLTRLILTGAFIGLNWILLFEAYNYTTVATATLCYYMQPTIVILLSPLVFRERMTRKKAVCAAVSILGMVLVSGVIGERSAQRDSLRGILLGLGAAVFYAGVVITNKKTPGVGAYQRTQIQLLSAGAVMVPYLLATDGFRSEGFSVSAVLLLLIVGIVHTGIAYVMYFGSMEKLRVQTISVCSYIDPVAALLLSALFLHEPLTPLNLLGALLIIGSAVYSEIGSFR